MTTRPPSGDPSAPDAHEHGAADDARAGASSSFDAAQDLLQAALDEVRGSAPKAEPAPPAEPTAPKPKTPARPARSSATNAGASAVPAAAGGEAAAGSAAEATESTEFWAKPAAKTAGSAEAASTTSARRRRSSAAAPPSPDQPDDFDGLTGTLYQPTGRGKRRRRRPETVVGTVAVAGAVTASGTDPAPMLPEVPQATRSSNKAVESTAASVETAAAEPAPPATPEAEKPAAQKEPTRREPTAEAPAVVEVAADDTDELAPAVPIAAAAATTDRRAAATTGEPTETAAPRDGRLRAPWVIAAAIAALLAVGVLAVVVTGGGGSDDTAVQAGGKARLTFAPITTAEGATVTRTWELEGRKGDQFVGTLAITNPTSAPLETTFTEVIPKAIAADVSDITFDPQPVVIKADPVVEYRLTVPPQGTATATYEVAVSPDGADRRRLDEWARDLPQTTTSTTTTTTAPPGPATTTPPTTPATTPNRPPVTNAPVNPTTPPTSPPEPPPTNPPPTTGTIAITVISRGASGTFGYSTPVGGITLSTPGPDSPAGWSATVEAGSYTLTQVSSSGPTPNYFYLYVVSCSNGFSGSGPSASITVNPGEFVSCTFENRPR